MEQNPISKSQSHLDQHTVIKPLAVVTGASSGIGFGLAKQFADHGYDLLIASEDDGISSAAENLKSSGVSVDFVQTDLATYEGVEELYQRIKMTNRPVEAVAINAGVGVSGDFARDTDLREEINMIQLNVISPVHLTKRIIQEMVPMGRGRILYTASVAATMPGPFLAVYAATKAFLRSFAEAIRNELKETGVVVTTLMPGPTETSFFHRADMEDTKAGSDKSQQADPADVARDGFEALMKGEDYVVSATLSQKIQTYVGKVIPDAVKAQMHRKLAEPGSGEKAS